MTPDELEMKEKLWNDSDAQRLLRSLARLRRGSEQVCKADINDDLQDADDYQMTKKVLDVLVQAFCDKCLISKDKVNSEKGKWYCIPSIDRLVPFMNPQLGDLPDSDEENDDEEDEEENGSDESKEYSSGFSKSKRASYVSNDSKNERNNHLPPRKIVETIDCRDRTARNVLPEPSDESSVSSISMSFSTYNGTGQPLSGRDTSSSSRKVSSKKRKGEIVCIESSCNRMKLSSEPLTDVDDVPWGETTSPGTFKEQPEKKRRVYYAEHGDTPMKIAKKYQVDVERIIRDNKRRENYETISKHSIFEVNSPVVLPLELTDVDDVPWGEPTSPGTFKDQPEKKRRVYYAEHGDTPMKIAKKYQVDVEQIIRDNKRRENYETISKRSIFEVNSPVVFPM